MGLNKVLREQLKGLAAEAKSGRDEYKAGQVKGLAAKLVQHAGAVGPAFEAGDLFKARGVMMVIAANLLMLAQEMDAPKAVQDALSKADDALQAWRDEAK